MNIQAPVSEDLFSDFVKSLEADQYCAEILFDFKQTHALNANLLIFLLWFAQAQYGRLTKKELSTLGNAVAYWHERVLLPLRRVAALAGASRLKVAIKESVQEEVEFANLLEQQSLAEALALKALVRSKQQQLGDAAHNVSLYFKQLKIHLDNKSKEQSIYLLQFVFPSMKDSAIKKACENALQALTSGAELGPQLSLGEL